MQCPFAGSLVALPTPFQDGRLDLQALRDLIEEQVATETTGVVVCGTTGEGCNLTKGEHKTAIATAVRFARERIHVIAGVGSNSTTDTLVLAKFAEDSGAHGLLVVTPYYNRPNRSGLLLHFEAVARATSLPILLYNVPTRTGLDLEPGLVREIFEHNANVVGIKEVTHSLLRIRELRAIEGLALFCGEDSALSVFAREGAAGAIGVIANLAPNQVAELLHVARTDAERAAELEWELAPLLAGLYLETNPVPLKAALARGGRCSAEVRLPLGPLSDEHARELPQHLDEFERRGVAPKNSLATS